MLNALDLISGPILLLPSNGKTKNIPNIVKLPQPAYRRNFQICLKKSFVCAAKRGGRKPNGIGRSGRLVMESAFIIASRLRLVPEPVELLLREFGFGNGNGNRGGNGFWKRFGGGGFGGRNRRMKLGILGILIVCCAAGFWFGIGKELALDGDALLGVLCLLLLGLCVPGWESRARDWFFGFCCCAFVVLVLNRDKFSSWVPSFGKVSWVPSFGKVKKNGRRKLRIF